MLEEAEAQSLNVRLMLPSDPSTIESVEAYIERLERYSVLWLGNKHASFSLTPLDGYIEYKFAVALGHTPKDITNHANHGMHRGMHHDKQCGSSPRRRYRLSHDL